MSGGEDRGDPGSAGAPRAPRSLLRSIGLLGLAQAAAMLLNLAALVVIARQVGDTWFGVLQWGAAFSAYALVVSEWGLGTLGVRELARVHDAGAARVYVGSHVGLMLVLGLVALAVGALVLPFFPMYRIDPVILLLFLATVLPSSVTLDWVGVGRERFGDVATAKVLRSLLYAAVVLVLLGAADGLAGWGAARWVPVFFLGSWFVTVAYLAARARSWLGAWPWPRFGPWHEWRRRLGEAGPLGAGLLVMRLLLNLDLLILGVLAAPAVVGNYAAAAKVVFVLVIAVEVMWKALLPQLARAWQESRERCRRRFSAYLGVIVLGGVPLAVAGVASGREVMALLYGDRFPQAGEVCRVLSVAYVALAMGQFLGNGLIATDRQRRFFGPLSLAAAVALASLFALVPDHGATGAAHGMLAAHLVLVAATAWAARDLLHRTLGRPLAAAAAGALAFLGCHALAASWPIVPRLACGVVVYGLVAGAVSRRWWREVGQAAGPV